jgi:hypothetical protein
MLKGKAERRAITPDRDWTQAPSNLLESSICAPKSQVGQLICVSSAFLTILKLSLPVEILDQVVQITLEADNHAFASIANFALASHQFRQIALKRALSRCEIGLKSFLWDSVSTWIR